MEQSKRDALKKQMEELIREAFIFEAKAEDLKTDYIYKAGIRKPSKQEFDEASKVLAEYHQAKSIAQKKRNEANAIKEILGLNKFQIIDDNEGDVNE